jgi:broad specificity phosphatase PhoE
MDIYIVRHGETQWNKEEVFRGKKDIPLNETGRRQAELTGAYFRDIPVKRIISSPLARAVETAEGIATATGVPVERVDELTDINFGIWEGLSLREVEERYPAAFALWKASPEKLRIEGGETLAEVRERVSRGLPRQPGLAGAVIIVTHRAICKILVLSLLHMGEEHFWAIKYDPGSITLLEGDGARFTLIFSNDTCHQRDGLKGVHYRDF